MKLSVSLSVGDLVNVQPTFLEKCISTFGNKKEKFSKKEISRIFHDLKKSGVEGVELLIPFLSTDQNISDILEMTRIYGLPVLSLHQSLTSLTQIELAEIIRLCYIANQFSAKVIVLHSGALGQKLFDPEFVQILKSLQKKHNVTFGIENMPKTPMFFGRAYTYDTTQFLYMIDDAGLPITLDTTHLAQTGGDIVSFYEENKKRIVNIHLSDYQNHWLNTRFFLENHTHLSVSKGELPIQKFMALLKKSHYSGLVTLEVDGVIKRSCDSAQIIRKMA